MMVDLDDFKRLNDTQGHRRGDLALIEVGEILTAHTWASAVVARVVGEEFLIADLDGPSAAVGCAKRLRDAIAKLEDFGLTVSVGVASTALCTHPVDGYRALIDDLFDAADIAMYTAKRAGGNQVCVSSQPWNAMHSSAVCSTRIHRPIDRAGTECRDWRTVIRA